MPYCTEDYHFSFLIHFHTFLSLACSIGGANCCAWNTTTIAPVSYPMRLSDPGSPHSLRPFEGGPRLDTLGPSPHVSSCIFVYSLEAKKSN